MGLGVFNIILVGMFSFIHSSIAIPELNKETTIEVRILRVPAFQSIMKPAPPVESGVEGVVMGGNVTASFPEVFSLLLHKQLINLTLIQKILCWRHNYPGGFLPASS